MGQKKSKELDQRECVEEDDDERWERIQRMAKESSEKENYEEEYPSLEEKIGIGIIGIGQRSLSLLRRLLSRHKDLVRIVAVSDESKDALENGVGSLSWFLTSEEKNDLKVFSDFRHLLSCDGIEWILIGSKNCLHRDQCIASFEAGKHVFCEKPLATTIEECLDIKSSFEAHDSLHFATGFVLRHAPFYQVIKKVLVAGHLGKIVSVQANELLAPPHGGYIMRNWRRYRSQAGPHILEKCCHDIDVMNWLIDSLPVRVSAFGGLDSFLPENKPNSQGTIIDYHDWPAYESVDAFESEKDIEDNIVVILEYANRVRVCFHSNSNTLIPQRSLLICGVKGSIQGDLISSSLTIHRFEKPDADTPAVENVTFGAQYADMHGGGDDLIVDDWAQSMFTKQAPKATGEEGFRSAVVCLAIDEARLTGQVVDLTPWWSKFNVRL